jgi:DMSO/TMAO reductase YedYZ molybdopterin-dependent catalytic subunit
VYVRSNFPTPALDASHKVMVRDAEQNAREFVVAEFADWPQHELLVTMECAGNWRLGMEPVPAGEPWSWGAVSTTRWRGVRLADVLAKVGVQPDVLEVVAVGADSGPRDDATQPGAVTFARALPIEVAMHPDTLLATDMDGQPLTPDHGAPLRLVVPGWYGMASVKWVAALELVTTPFMGYFQRQRYVYRTTDGVQPVTRARVKSFVVSPEPDERCGADVLLRGWAWSGHGPIAEVSVQVGDGPWVSATLEPPASEYAWAAFTLPLSLPTGSVTVRTRARDTAGHVQPERVEWNDLGYGNNAIRSFTLHVAD